VSWFQQNRFLGSFLIGGGVATLLAFVLLIIAKSEYRSTNDRLNETATELSRLQKLNPFPNPQNLHAMKTQATEYALALGKMKEKLKTRVLPVTPLQPNEFQARLRETVTKVMEKARTNKVRLPENFFLGFEEFAAALPGNEAAGPLGQQLAQAELIANILIDAHVDSITAFKRSALPEEHVAAMPTPSPSHNRSANGTTNGPTLIDRSTVDTTFNSTPSAARRVLNRIASANEQFLIIRTLHVTNEKQAGPARAQSTSQSAEAENKTPSTSAAAKPNNVVSFIVGNEHVQTTANIELVRFTF
jgi:hypothetical protein